MLFSFDLVVDRDLTEEDDANAVYEAFEDVTPAVLSGIPVLMCSVEAPTLEEAVRPMVTRLRDLGIRVKQIRFDPDAVLA